MWLASIHRTAGEPARCACTSLDAVAANSTSRSWAASRKPNLLRSTAVPVTRYGRGRDSRRRVVTGRVDAARHLTARAAA